MKKPGRTLRQRVLALFLPQPSPSRLAYDALMRRLDGIDARLTVLAQPLALPHQQATGATMDAIVHRLDALDARLASITEAPSHDQVDGLQGAIVAVEKQISRSGREQLKANVLAEAQQEQLRAALELLQHNTDQFLAREGAARLALMQRILPALDGLDEALRSGTVLLAPSPPQPMATIWDRMRAVAPALPQEEAHVRDALRAWMHGLTFVRQRLLDVLASEQIRPMEVEGNAFDPHLHVALEAVPARPGVDAGTVIAELRRGYIVGNRVWRHAEVVVAQANAHEVAATADSVANPPSD